jgi:hypothetical protein
MSIGKVEASATMADADVSMIRVASLSSAVDETILQD